MLMRVMHYLSTVIDREHGLSRILGVTGSEAPREPTGLPKLRRSAEIKKRASDKVRFMSTGGFWSSGIWTRKIYETEEITVDETARMSREISRGKI
jgi:hypothetical protein